MCSCLFTTGGLDPKEVTEDGEVNSKGSNNILEIP